MKKIEINETFNLSVDKVWSIFTNFGNYPKYFKYIKKVFYKGEMKNGSIWFDLATVVYFPALVLHKVTKFEENKRIEFYVPLPFVGKIIETVDFWEENKKTHVKAIISYDYGPIFGPLFNKIFEKRFTEMLRDGLIKFKKEFPST